ncbi:GNAT family N-acetyltransferase [Enterococcus saccharolyticus]|uniref:N-acetyltransferase domain-containing protein n=1 Tax=Enterococcus saccharolyticus subsp. saccharolyticus ATCC 43076 TaxID=1139996 RepID=S0NZ04_9ENTE|nr:GNAT family N-acetyltransferase [Enterococcus saccharolyticus]EOT25710.1 hypothetical protein OMQ_02597 [Enterococcus saccharolyticus subsp. saccharolyticus ATCC 43076]EOT83180.1 hypothetical protein I572_00049 [Enterococcus saccharolyticus subsp. saccharolyticus ATCC 43076]OJG90524.1 hypothetical protein RV16_GL001473 [Enterococcus saccharolyticus]
MSKLEEELNRPQFADFFQLACYDEKRLVGYLSVVSNGATDAYIQDVMVAPAYQGQGIGTTLIELSAHTRYFSRGRFRNQAIAKIKAHRIYMIHVIYGEESLRKYYEKFGFYTMLAGQMESHEV